MQQLFEAQAILLKDFQSEPFYNREIFKQITLDNHATGIVGSRGVGKTTLLLHQTLLANEKEQKALYVSGDNIYFLEHRLYDLADQLYKETDVTLLCIDEIHKYKNWQQELKNIVDTFRRFKVLFTGSSMIDIVRGKYDLSRRVTLHHLHGFSFREYLEFSTEKKYPIISFEQLIKEHLTLANNIDIAKPIQAFQSYCRLGYYPFFKELSQDTEKFQAIQNVIQKTIYEDIATFYSLKTPTLLLLEKLFQYVISSSPGELNAYKLAKILDKDFVSISGYLKILNESGLIRYLHTNKAGKAMLRNPEKMYPENTNMITASLVAQPNDNIIGKMRETFTLATLQNAGLKVYYGAQGDFVVNDFVFEVGGKNKTLKQLKDVKNGYLLCDNILVGDRSRIPLYLLGFLY